MWGFFTPTPTAKGRHGLPLETLGVCVGNRRRRAVRAARIVRAAAEGGSALVEYREAWDV